jgi:hypothetical protein
MTIGPSLGLLSVVLTFALSLHFIIVNPSMTVYLKIYARLAISTRIHTPNIHHVAHVPLAIRMLICHGNYSSAHPSPLLI